MKRIHLLLLPLFLSACAHTSAPPSDASRWFTPAELANGLPASCRTELVAYLKRTQIETWDEWVCVTKDGIRSCADFSCEARPELACWWHEPVPAVREALSEWNRPGKGKDFKFSAQAHCPGHGEEYRGTAKENESLCRRGIFQEDRESCLRAYFDHVKADAKKAEELLALSCSKPNVWCLVNGKVRGTLKKKPSRDFSLVKEKSTVDGVTKEFEYGEPTAAAR